MNSRATGVGPTPGKPPNLTSQAVQIHHGLPHFSPDRRRIVTTGTFDGVHLGHRALLKWMTTAAQKQDAETVVLTFDPHPRQVLFGADSGLQLLQTLEQRSASLASTGLDHLVIQPFDRAFSRLRPEDFVRDVLVDGLGTTTIVVGHDHRFGAGREGDVDLLRSCGETFGFEVAHIPAHIAGEITVSSTKCRQRIARGEVRAAQALLGDHHTWRGRVVAGHGRGRQLGYRTANLEAVEPLQILPAQGVYAARFLPVHNPSAGDARATSAHEGWPAMVHIGPRPTFIADGGEPTVEAHVMLPGDLDLYGHTADLAFVERLRDVRRFDGPEALVAQIERDALATRKALGYD